MITKLKARNFYEEFFQKSLYDSAQPSWLKDLRVKAFDYFLKNGFPSVENEEWKYTSTALIARETFSICKDSFSKQQVKGLIYQETQHSCIVFSNGHFSKELSDVKALSDVEILSFNEALTTKSELLEKALSKQVDYQRNGFTALNTAFVEEGLLLLIPKAKKVNTPIQILFLSSENAVSFPRILIIAEEETQTELIESYFQVEESKYFTNSVIEIKLADKANFKHYRIQKDSHRAFHITTTDVEVGQESHYDSTNITLGAKWSCHEISVRFKSERGKAFVDGLYMLAGEQFADTHSVIDHLQPNCTSRQNYKGIIHGKSRAVFNGKILVRENSTGTDAHQSNKNLLLSGEARIDTKPQLEIFNDDVQCSHGATVGQLEEEEIFYLMSRGLNINLAKNLLTYGFAEEIINKITAESIRTVIDELILNRLSAKL